MVQQSVWGSNVWIDVCIVSLLNSKWSTVRLWPVHCEQTSYECVSGVFCIKPWGCCLSSCATYYHMTESFRSYEPFPNLTCNSYPPQHHDKWFFFGLNSLDCVFEFLWGDFPLQPAERQQQLLSRWTKTPLTSGFCLQRERVQLTITSG